MTTTLDCPIAEVYSNPENVKAEICRIRELFGNKNTTQKQFKVIYSVLGLMTIHCPESLRSIVQLTLLETTRRQFYFILYIWK